MEGRVEGRWRGGGGEVGAVDGEVEGRWVQLMKRWREVEEKESEREDRW